MPAHGIKLYLREGDIPDLQLGDRVRVTGYVREFHRQREIEHPRPHLDHALDSGAPLGPAPPPPLLPAHRPGRASHTRAGW